MEILKLTPKTYKEVLKETISLLRKGKIVISPTDTVYGLLAHAQNKKAVERIFKVKKRPKDKPLPIFVEDLKMAKKFAKINKSQEEFLRKIWPGKVTVILKRHSPSKAKIYGLNKTSIALRIPKYKLINEILEKIDSPLIGTSANISGKKPSTEIREVLDEFLSSSFSEGKEDLPDLILDGGDLKKSKPSTVVDLREKKIKIIRQGEVEIKVDTL